MLTVKLMLARGIEVLPVHFFHLFNRKDKAATEAAFAALSEKLGATVRVVDVSAPFLEVVQHPACGYGSNINPCIDCKAFMLGQAKKLMQEWGASFLMTGEVVGQRPMSQYKDAMRRIEKLSGTVDLVVRPLCGKLLPETLPEQQGWIKREWLLDFNGRGRLRQIALAKELGIKDFPWPGGGCLLTEPGFCRKLKNVLEHGEFTVENIERLKLGRHFRLPSGALIALGRNDAQNQQLAQSGADAVMMGPRDEGGPYCLLPLSASEADKGVAAGVIARYTDKTHAVTVWCRENGVETTRSAMAISDDEVERMQL